MASTPSQLLRAELQAPGENNSTWGDKTNSNFEHVFEQAIAGMSVVDVTVGHTLSVNAYVVDEARSAILVATGAPADSAQKIIIPALTKTYMVRNATSTDKSIRIGTAGGAYAVVSPDSIIGVFCDGTDTYATVDTGLLIAVQQALDLKANINAPTFTGTVGGISKGMVGLGNVDNTADAGKPVSTQQQSALDLKAPLADPAFTGVPTAPTAAAGTNTTQVATTAHVKAAVDARGTPAGAVLPFAMSAAPTGWLKCNGAAVSRATYSTLFDAIGTTFGVGDGSTTFALPDLRGEFVRGYDDGRGIDAGRSFGSAQAAGLPNINAYAQAIAGQGTVSTGAITLTNYGGQFGSSGGGTFANLTFSAQASNAIYGNSTTVQPINVALLYCIKT